jgi:hypothetical protein
MTDPDCRSRCPRCSLGFPPALDVDCAPGATGSPEVPGDEPQPVSSRAATTAAVAELFATVMVMMIPLATGVRPWSVATVRPAA